MKNYFILAALLIFMVSFSAYAYEPTGPLKITGDKKVDGDIENLGYCVSFDEAGFIADLSATYQVPEKEIAELSKKIYLKNAYVAIVLSRLSGKSLDSIAGQYKPGEGAGWGQIVRGLGIEPGSRKFQILGKETEVLLKRAETRKQVAEAGIEKNLKVLGLDKKIQK